MLNFGDKSVGESLTAIGAIVTAVAFAVAENFNVPGLGEAVNATIDSVANLVVVAGGLLTVLGLRRAVGENGIGILDDEDFDDEDFDDEDFDADEPEA